MIFGKQAKIELISLHIPKTAGTSFRNILKSVYGEKQVVRFDINEKQEVRLNEKIYNGSELPAVKVIHGHFSMEHIKSMYRLPEKYKLITWVREPVQRVISNYFYLESRLADLLDEEKNNLNILSKMKRSLVEYARAEVNRNRQSKFIKGSELTDFNFIGIQEEYEQELRRLAHVLSWDKEPPLLHHNKTSDKPRMVDAEIKEEIKMLNEDDMKIYESALKLKSTSL